MKNCKPILPVLILLQLNFCNAQKDSVTEKEFDRFYVSLTGGVGIPLGEFAKYDDKPKYNFPLTGLNHNLTGEPETGITFKLSPYYLFSEYAGMTCSFYTGSFKATTKSIEETAGFSFDTSSYATKQEYDYDTKSWTTKGFLIGFFANAPLHRFNIAVKILGGIQHSGCPETSFYYLYQHYSSFSAKTIYAQPAVSSTGFCWDGGLDIRISIHPKINILLSADYISAKSSFTDSVLLDTQFIPAYGWDPPSSKFSFKYEKQITYLSINAGIAYVFNRKRL
jgi:hypothetical protein